MGYKRDSVPVGQTVTLRAIFLNGSGEPMDVDSMSVKVYDPSGAVDGIYTSVTNISTGYYELDVTLSATATTGVWTDEWTGTISGVDVKNTFKFTVEEMGSAQTQTIGNNTLIVVLIEKTIADSDGRTLEEEQQVTFSTRYSPYYASPDLIRAEVGTWLDSIPDDTLSLLIHWSSKEVDLITPAGIRRHSNYSQARTMFVIYDVALRCLTLPAAGTGSGTKMLGDLMIKKNLDFRDAVEDLKKKRQEWFRVVNAKGNITPGQSFAPSIAVKGSNHPENRRVGRLWWNPLDYPYAVPIGNRKIRKAGERKFRKGHVDIIDGSYFPPDEEPD